MKDIYFDNSATTRVFPEVAELMTKIMCEDYGNPSSMHNKGVDSEKYLKSARETLAKSIKVNEKEILFTSCGTESDNMALIGCARANARRGKHLITTKIEHPAILNAMKQLELEGFEVTYLGTDSNGIISLEELKGALRPDTILVSVMHINNEIGSVQPIKEIGKLIKEYDDRIYFHVDDVQGFSKLKLLPKKMNIDMMSVSAHKIHGPKGMGFLYISDKVKLFPIIYGGGQQNGMRSGTENVPGIAGMAKAAEILLKDYEKDILKLYGMKKHFISEAVKIEAVSVNGIPCLSKNGKMGFDNMSEDFDSEALDKALNPNSEDLTFEERLGILEKYLGAPHVVSVSVEDVRAEVMLHSLEDKGIYVSAGSACSTHKRAASATLTAINLDKKFLESTVRFSFSVMNTDEEIDEAIEVMSSLVPMLRKYIRK